MSKTETDEAQLDRLIRKAKTDVAKVMRPARATASSRPKPQEVSPEKTTTPCMKEIGGSSYGVWNDALLHRTAMTAPRLVPKGEDPAGVNERNASIAGLGLRAFRPADPVQAMLASQAMGLHFATMECLRLAAGNVNYPDIASKLRRDAANLSRAMIESTEALYRRQGKGGQVVRVERVVVNGGGQAIVGAVSTGEAFPTAAPVAAISQGPAPIEAAEVEPVVIEEARQ